MKWFELLKFSFGNLWRRKLRTSLTVLGVMIGTASIVVMMSLGIGLSHSYTQIIENSSTLTLITVYSNGRYGGGTEDSDSAYLTDDTVAGFSSISHVMSASPVYSFSAIMKSGKYESWMNVNAMSLEMLRALKIPLIEGALPVEGDALSFLVGKEVGYNFYDPNSSGDMYMYGGYSESSERAAPPVDIMEDSIYVIYDTDAYYSSQGGTGTPPKKYPLSVAALVGEQSSEYGWSQYDYSIYADFDAVSSMFNKLFKKSAWPNQQTDKNGKPITPMRYDQAYVLVDDIDNVASVQKQISDMGFQASSELDYLKSMQEQSRIIQYVLAGIGSVSLIVAAIGITNTMLMSIFERTKEIGIFKVLGCSLSNIRSMFLMEAALIGLSGGVFGVGLSLALSAVLKLLFGEISIIPIWLALLGMAFAVVVGMVSGISPALRAMKLSPLEAIRTL